MAEAPASKLPNDPESIRYKRPPQFYFVWQQGEKIPIHDTFHIDHLAELDVGDWELFGGKGCFINLADSFLVGAFLLEIPPGKALKRIHHMFEAQVYVVDGHGETVVEHRGQPASKVQWKPQSLFSPPLNTTYVHRNLDSAKPARLLVVTNAPLVMSLFHDERFIFNNQYEFDRRYNGEADYYTRPSEYMGSSLSRTNIIDDVSTIELYSRELRGKGNRTSYFTVASNTLAAHISQFPVGTYKKAHRHGAGAHVVVLNGQGYSLLWKDGEPRQRVNWQRGSMLAPPEWAWHQHFNTGPEPARYLAIRNNNPEHPLRLGLPRFDEGNKTAFGASQIDLVDEDPAIYEEYAAELRKNGVEIKMPKPGTR